MTSCVRGLAPGLAALIVACAPLAPPRRATESHPPPPREAGLRAARQMLYRVQYDGPAGRGSLRLVLRQVAADRFQLLASDALGRAAWSLDHDAEAVLLIDHRQRRYCLSASDLRVPEIALAPLPLITLPRVLAGLAPVPPPVVAMEQDWVDAAGRNWSLVRAGESVSRWTLWQQGEPQLWWQRRPKGGILSHRQGSQFRWRLVVREELKEAGYRRLEAPPEYSGDGCPVEPSASRSHPGSIPERNGGVYNAAPAPGTGAREHPRSPIPLHVNVRMPQSQAGDSGSRAASAVF